ncbi:MAG: hypothetical protein VR64_01750 [Desulfatitalea sp. BRH_c12]|nr:MAG: hypothetical protein VR64_01750 [Desulfatitalea sp. BRH_c12]
MTGEAWAENIPGDARAPSGTGTEAAPAATELAPVVVTAPRIASEISRVPAAVSVIDNADIQQGRPAVKLDDALRRVPGLYVQNEHNFAQDLRISMRGFGARSAFGVRGIQIYVDGIPQTLPDGQTPLEAIDPSAIGHIEVMRGPISALYGNASGGVITIVTQDAPLHPFMAAKTVIGAYGLEKYVLQGGGQTGRYNGFATLSHLRNDGYRAHSQAENTLFSGKLRFDIDDVSDLTLLVNTVDAPQAQDPGGLTAEQVRSDPSQAAPLSLLYNTGEEFNDERIGLVYRRALRPRHNLEVAGYASQRDLENAIPFRFIELDRQVTGGRVQYDASATLAGHAHRMVAGIDLQHQADDRNNFDNVGGRPGDTMLLSQDEAVTALGVYLQDEVSLTHDLSLVLGGRYDRVRFRIDDRFLADGDDSGSRVFDQFTGRLGWILAPLPDLRLYANIAQSFETPTSTEVVNRPDGGGGINPEIEPQRATNYEIGLRRDINRSTSVQAAVFYIRLEDELIAFRDATDRVFYRNAGESRRIGAEIEWTHKFLRDWEFHLAYTYLDAQFENYRKDARDLDGNDVPGLPRHQIWNELVYRHASGIYAAASAGYIGRFYVDDENTLSNDHYTVVDLRTGFIKQWTHWRIEPFVGVRNLFDAEYNGNVRINAAGGRYFEPAPPVNVYGGIALAHEWQ